VVKIDWFNFAKIGTWVILAILVYMFKRKIPLVNAIRMKASTLAIVIIVIGFLYTGASLGNLSTVSSVDSGGVVLSNMYFTGGVINTTGASPVTTDDYLSNDDKVLTFYVDDADVDSTGYINATIVLERTNVNDAGSVTMVCTSPDFSVSGTTYNWYAEDTSQNIYLYIDGAGTRSENSVTKIIPFAEADESVTVEFKGKHSSTGRDALSSKEQGTVTCTAGGKTVSMIHVANT
jgi:hypothetical protein